MSDFVTRRPQRGSAYARDTSYTNQHWDKIDEPGGRDLWFKLVFGFTSLAVFGTVLLALGSTFFQRAYDFHRDGNTALPMALCVIGIVCGALMFFGSVIMGKMVISNKWRTNQKPNYGRQNRARSARVRYATNTDNSSPQVEIDIPPPPYDHDFSQGPQSVFCLNRSSAMEAHLPPPPPDLYLSPPDYGEATAKPPSYSTLDPSVIHSTTQAKNSPMGVVTEVATGARASTTDTTDPIPCLPRDSV